MSSPLYRSVALACGATLLGILPAGAAARRLRRSHLTDLRVEDVRTAFSQVGLVVAEPVGASGGFVQIVEAHSPTSSEIARAFVFSDSAVASDAGRRAQAMSDGILSSDDVGPQLLSGYGASAWRRNVAVVKKPAPTRLDY